MKKTKRINQSMNVKSLLNSKGVSMGKNDDVIMIRIPDFFKNEISLNLFMHMSAYVAEYMEYKGIATVEQWNSMADNPDFKYKTINYVMGSYTKVCCKYLKVDMIEYASVLLELVEDFSRFDKKWCDGFVTPRTGLKYELLPILQIFAKNVYNNIQYLAPSLLDWYNKQSA